MLSKTPKTGPSDPCKVLKRVFSGLQICLCGSQCRLIASFAVLRKYLLDNSSDGVEYFAGQFAWFLQASSKLRQEYPQRCLVLIEKSRQLGLLDERLSGETEKCIGYLYVRLGRYEDAVQHLERARLQMVNDPGLLWDLTVTYAKLHRYNEAIATLDSLPKKRDWVVLVIELFRELKDVPTLREIADALKARPEAPDRRMFQELIEEVTSLRSTLRGDHSTNRGCYRTGASPSARLRT